MRVISVAPLDLLPDGSRPTDKSGRPLRPGADRLRVTEADRPEPAADEVLVRTVASGINRADLLQRQGLYPPPAGISQVMGLEASGVIESVGEAVTTWQPGDEVVALLAGGGYGEYFVVPAGQVLAPPPGVDLITAGTVLEVAATVVSNVDHVGLTSGETVLIHGGAGGVGSFAIQYAKALGCRVAVTAGSRAKLDFCQSLGATITLDYHDDWLAGLLDATEGDGADVILDIMGAKYLESNVAALATDGRCVIIGMQGGTKGTLDIARLLSKRATVTATSLRFRSPDDKAQICTRVAEVVWPLIERQQIVPAPVEQFSFEQAAAAHARLESGEVTGKLVLVH